MKKALLLLFINLILVLLQISFFGELLPSVYVPNLILSFSFAILFADLSDASYMSAFIGGLMLDLLTFGIIGVSSLTFVGFLFLFSFVRRYVSKNVLTNSLGVVVLQSIYVWFILGFKAIGISKLLISGVVTLLAVFMFQFILKGFLDYLGRSGYKILK